MIFKSKNNQGFTLVEVMVTIAVSGILFAMIAAVVASFVNSYKHSTRIRELNYEVETIENYVTLSIEALNSSGHTLSLTYDVNTGFAFINTTENKEILIYDKTNKTISFGTSTLDLEYTSDISIKRNDTGLVLTITTIDNTTFVSYYKVLNLLESGGN